MKKLQFIMRYLRYRLKATTKYGIHSPFIYDFVVNVLNDERHFYAYDEIEKLRNRLLRQKEEIEIIDYGAGSSTQTGNTRTIAAIARHSAKSPRFGRLFFRMVNYYKVNNILELGTSLGLSTAYMAKANTSAKVITIEGCPGISARAKESFNLAGLKNIELVTGSFEEKLPGVLSRSDRKFDLVFIDGNHRFQPVWNYFQQVLPYLHNDSILIIDDIHWSAEMEKAWSMIKSHDSVQMTIDLFFLGIVFFRRENAKQHFVIRF